MLSVNGLRKRFGEIEAVKGVTFEVPSGICYGLLGPNGAGKTTTISMIVGILEPDAGSVLVEGKQVGLNRFDAKRLIGYVPQELAIYDELSARDNLAFFGALYGLGGASLDSQIDKALEVTSLSDRARDSVKTYSGGMKRRLNIAIALLHSPKLLILDEPSVGVDPQSRNAIFDTLEALRADGLTLLYTTHYMEEAERMCQRIAVMDHGEIVAEDTVSGLQKLLPAANTVTLELDSAPLQCPISGKLEGTTLQVEIENIATDLPRVLNQLKTQNIGVLSVASKETSLEEVFLHLTGKSLRD